MEDGGHESCLNTWRVEMVQWRFITCQMFMMMESRKSGDVVLVFIEHSRAEITYTNGLRVLLLTIDHSSDPNDVMRVMFADNQDPAQALGRFGRKQSSSIS